MSGYFLTLSLLLQAGENLWEVIVGLATTLGGTVLAAVGVALRVQLGRLGNYALAKLSRGRRPAPENPENRPEQPRPIGTVQGQHRAADVPRSGNPFADWNESNPTSQ